MIVESLTFSPKSILTKPFVLRNFLGKKKQNQSHSPFSLNFPAAAFFRRSFATYQEQYDALYGQGLPFVLPVLNLQKGEALDPLDKTFAAQFLEDDNILARRFKEGVTLNYYDFSATPDLGSDCIASLGKNYLELPGYNPVILSYFGDPVHSLNNPATLSFSVVPNAISNAIAKDHLTILEEIAKIFSLGRLVPFFFRLLAGIQEKASAKASTKFTLLRVDETKSIDASWHFFLSNISANPTYENTGVFGYPVCSIALNTNLGSLPRYSNLLPKLGHFSHLTPHQVYVDNSNYFCHVPNLLLRFEESGLEVKLNFTPSWGDFFGYFCQTIRIPVIFEESGLTTYRNTVFLDGQLYATRFELASQNQIDALCLVAHLHSHLWFHENLRHHFGEPVTALTCALKKNQLGTSLFQEWLRALDHHTGPLINCPDLHFFEKEWPVWLAHFLRQFIPVENSPSSLYHWFKVLKIT